MAQRLDRSGEHRTAFEKNRARVLASQDICGICGKPVDKSIKYPHPFSPTVDHIIPLSKGGHPSDISNLQLAHRCCNRAKSDKIIDVHKDTNTVINNRDLPQSMDWTTYRQG